MGTNEQRLQELLKLPRAQRSKIVEALLESLDGEEPQADVVQTWATEIIARIERASPGIPAEQVFAEGRARLKADG